MRVIAGNAKGRRLLTPKGKSTRPTSDRVREALFSILGNRVESMRALDLFAGSGALGIEALSRGAAHCTFVERSPPVVALLKKNLSTIPEQSYTVRPMEAYAALELEAKRRANFDLVFLDPPYDANLLHPTFKQLARLALVPTAGLVVCEHRSNGPAPPAPEDWVQTDRRRYGDSTLSFFRTAQEKAQ